MRNPEVILVAGRNGSGKTTLAKKLVARLRPVVISPTGEWGEWHSMPETIAARAVADKASCLVLDDSDAYLTGRTSEFWRRLLSTNRHLGLDVVLITRRPQELPHWAVAAATRAYILALGPREAAWCRRLFAVEPPTTMHQARAIAL